MPVVICPPYYSPQLLQQLNKAGYDPYYNYVVSLMHFEDVVGSSVISDTVGNPVNVYTGTTIDNTITKWGTSSAAFTGQRGIGVPMAPIGTQDFTIECWVNAKNFSSASPAIFDGRPGSNGNYPCLAYTGGILYYYPSPGNVTYDITATLTLSDNVWYHLAVSRTGSTTKVFVNGAQVASGNDPINYANTLIGWGANQLASGANYQLVGNIDEARVTIGVGRYQASFIPPASPFPNKFATSLSDPLYASNSLLLLCNGTDGAGNGASGVSSDISANNWSITKTGNYVGSVSSPFTPAVGSYQFDGSSWFTITDAPSLRPEGSDFTVEFWWNPSNTTDLMEIYTKGAGLQIYQYNGTMNLALSASNTTSYFISAPFSGALVAGTWYHIAFVRSGNTYTAYINGAVGYTVVNATNMSTGTSVINIGSYSNGNYPIKGKLSHVRFVKGTAVYTAAFTPPTAPLTAITNTQLLIPFTAVATADNIVDSMGLSTFIGTSTLRAANSKFGGTSLSCPSAGSTMTSSTGNAMVFGTADFTIEGWIRATSITGNGTILSNKPTLAAFPGTGSLSFNSTGKLYWAAPTGITVGPSTVSIPTNIWCHVAAVRTAGYITIYLNGVNVATAADVVNYSGTGVGIGSHKNNAESLIGFMDDIRITIGVARYLSNFKPIQISPATTATPPTITYDPSVVFALEFDNTTVVDNTGINTITNNGVVATTQQYVNNAAGAFLTGSSSYIAVPSSSAFALGTNDFTLEAYVNNTAYLTMSIILDTRMNGSSLTGIVMYIDSVGKLCVKLPSGTVISGGYIPMVMWAHVACVRIAGVFTLYVDGNKVATLTSSENITDSYLTVGRQRTPAVNSFTGYMDRVRITKGVGVYTGEFVPPLQ